MKYQTPKICTSTVGWICTLFLVISLTPEGISSHSIPDVYSASVCTEGECLASEMDTFFLDFTTWEPGCADQSNGAILVDPYGGAVDDASLYDYIWNTGDTGRYIQNLSVGTYSVTVTSPDSCTVVGSVSLDAPVPVYLFLDEVKHPCDGDSNGYIEVEVYGGFLFVLWYDAITGNSIGSGERIDGLSAGTYRVVALGDGECGDSDTIVLVDQPGITLVLPEEVVESCAGASDGSIDLSEADNNATDYIWSNGDLGPVVTGLAPGEHSVTATNSGCRTVETFTVLPGPQIVSVEILGDSSLACFNDSNAVLTCTVSDGIEDMSILWSTGDTTQTLDGLPAGAYSVTLTDTNGCTGVSSIDILQPDQFYITTTSSGESAPGASDGEVSVTPFGGVAPYNYSWSNDSNAQMIDSLPPGVLEVTVVDANGCLAVEQVYINKPGCEINASIEVSDKCASEDVVVFVKLSDQQGEVSILWSDGSTSDSIPELVEGRPYSVTVTDTAGCVAQAYKTIILPEEFVVESTIFHETGQAAADGAVFGKVFGGTPPYTLPGKMIEADSFSVTGLFPGDYVFQVLDANACVIELEVTILPYECQLDYGLDYDQFVCSGDSSIVKLSGESIANAQWSDGRTGFELMIPAGTWCVTVTDIVGCTAEECFDIEEWPPISVQQDKIIDAEEGEANGAIIIDVQGGSPPYSYIWTDDNGNVVRYVKNAVGLAPGNYSVEVTDSEGCVKITGPFQIGITTSIEIVNRIGLVIYPNPAVSTVSVGWDTNIDLCEIQLWSASGSLVSNLQYHVNDGTLELNIESLQSGVYYLTAVSDEGPVVSRFVKLQ